MSKTNKTLKDKLKKKQFFNQQKIRTEQFQLNLNYFVYDPNKEAKGQPSAAANKKAAHMTKNCLVNIKGGQGQAPSVVFKSTCHIKQPDQTNTGNSRNIRL